MAITLPQKLRIKEGTKILLLNAPRGIIKSITPLPKGAGYIEKAKQHDFIILFVKDKAELEKNIFSIIKLLVKGGLLWIIYPKIKSGIPTDLTRDKGWDCLNKIDWSYNSLISFDKNWTGFAMKNTPASNEPTKASKEYYQNVDSWIDTKNKTVKVPDDFEKALVKAKVKKFFDEQNFTNRKEFVIWIVSAKQEKTREERIAKAILKMKAGLRNPTMK